MHCYNLHICLALALLASWALASIAQTSTKPEVDALIVGGRDLEGAEPYMASLRSISGTHECGGTLIHPKAVLTAAHCIKRGGSLDVDVGRFERVGLDEDSGFESFKTAQVIVHENYDPVTFDYDIALLILDRAATPAHSPLPMASSDSCFERQGGCIVRLLGWGHTSEGGFPSRVLQEAKTRGVGRVECESLLQNAITERMICAGEIKDGKYDSCQGDSGGPLIQDDQLVGVVSFGFGCGRERSPGVYASVPKLRPWIDSKLSAIDSPKPPPRPATVLIGRPTQPPVPPVVPTPTPPLLPSTPASDPCDCAEDGVSNGVPTNRNGCKQHLLRDGDTDFFCMTVGGTDCPLASASNQFEGAAWILCN